MTPPERIIYEFGRYTFEPSENRLLREGKDVTPRGKLLDLLLVFVKAPNQLLRTEEDLLDAVWRSENVGPENVTVTVAGLRKLLGDGYIETARGGYRFIMPVKVRTAARKASAVGVAASSAPSPIARQDLMPSMIPNGTRCPPLDGALPLDSSVYIIRSTDADFHSAIERSVSFVHVKGPRQIGKTSLLARGLQKAREARANVVLIDLQALGDVLDSLERFLQEMGQRIADALELPTRPHEKWQDFRGACANFDRYLHYEVLQQIDAPLVWALDEVDRLLSCPYKNEVFGLFRSWHNLRALEPTGPWGRLTLALAYTTEAHLFIADIHQSPFNVGARIRLEDFTVAQMAELNRRYDSPLKKGEIDSYYKLVGGHPSLVQRGLYAVASGKYDFPTLVKQANQDAGIFGDVLRQMLAGLQEDPALCQAVRGFLQEKSAISPAHLHRLRSAGVLIGDSPALARPRCQLYADYLKAHLS